MKDTHWQALGLAGSDLGAALADARANGIASLQVEVESVEQLEQACAAGATRLLVDNQPAEVGDACEGAEVRDRDRGHGGNHAGERQELR